MLPVRVVGGYDIGRAIAIKVASYDGKWQFGLVAERLEKVNPALAARDERGEPYTVRYEAMNAMLLNEFLKEHRKVETLEATVGQLQSALRTEAAQIEKISVRRETNRSAPRVSRTIDPLPGIQAGRRSRPL